MDLGLSDKTALPLSAGGGLGRAISARTAIEAKPSGYIATIDNTAASNGRVGKTT